MSSRSTKAPASVTHTSWGMPKALSPGATSITSRDANPLAPSTHHRMEMSPLFSSLMYACRTWRHPSRWGPVRRTAGGREEASAPQCPLAARTLRATALVAATAISFGGSWLMIPRTLDAQVAASPGRAPARHALFGDLAIELRSSTPGELAIGAAGVQHALTLDVRASDARRWADSAARILALPRASRRRTAARGARAKGTSKGMPDASVPTPRRWRAVLEEPGMGQGSLVLVRVDSAGASRLLVYAADAELTELRQELEPDEARTFVAIVRRAAVAALPPPPKRRGKAKGAPARRPPSTSPATSGGSAPRKPA